MHAKMAEESHSDATGARRLGCRRAGVCATDEQTRSGSTGEAGAAGKTGTSPAGGQRGVTEPKAVASAATTVLGKSAAAAHAGSRAVQACRWRVVRLGRTIYQSGNPPTLSRTENQSGNPPTLSRTENQSGNPPTLSRTENKSGNPPTLSRTENQSGNPPTQSRTENQSGNPPAMSRTENQSGNRPTLSRTENQSGNPPTLSRTENQSGNPPTLSRTENQFDNPPTLSCTENLSGNPPTLSRTENQSGNPPTLNRTENQSGNPPTPSRIEIQSGNPLTLKSLSCTENRSDNPLVRATSSAGTIDRLKYLGRPGRHPLDWPGVGAYTFTSSRASDGEPQKRRTPKQLETSVVARDTANVDSEPPSQIAVRTPPNQHVPKPGGSQAPSVDQKPRSSNISQLTSAALSDPKTIYVARKQQKPVVGSASLPSGPTQGASWGILLKLLSSATSTGRRNASSAPAENSSSSGQNVNCGIRQCPKQVAVAVADNDCSGVASGSSSKSTGPVCFTQEVTIEFLRQNPRCSSPPSKEIEEPQPAAAPPPSVPPPPSNKQVPVPLDLQPRHDVSQAELQSVIEESIVKARGIAEMKGLLRHVSKELLFWHENPDWSEPTIPEERLEELTPPERLLTLREAVVSLREEPVQLVPVAALTGLSSGRAWQAIAKLHSELLRLRGDLLFTQRQVKFRELRLLQLHAKHRRLKSELKQKQRMWKRSDQRKDARIERLDKQVELFSEEERDQAAEKQRKNESMLEMIGEIFTPVQMTRMGTGKKNIPWAEEDIRRAIELKRMMTNRGYKYLRNVVKLPLPGMNVMRHAAEKIPELKEKYEHMVAANILKYATKKKKHSEGNALVTKCKEDAAMVDAAEDVPNWSRVLLPGDMEHQSTAFPPDISRQISPSARHEPPPGKCRKRPPPDALEVDGRQEANSSPRKRSAPARRGRPAAAHPDRGWVDWDAAELLWDTVKSDSSGVRKNSWIPAREGYL